MNGIDIHERQAGDVTILDLDGKIELGGGCVALRNYTRRLLGEGKSRAILNCAGAAHIDTSGEGELLSTHAAFKREGGRVVLLNLTEKIDLPVMIKLIGVFDSFDHEGDALYSFP